MSSRRLNIHIKREVGLGVSNTEIGSSPPKIEFRGDVQKEKQGLSPVPWAAICNLSLAEKEVLAESRQFWKPLEEAV